ncbi:hypothetical protein D3C78_1346220 [compost metagenome]
MAGGRVDQKSLGLGRDRRRRDWRVVAGLQQLMRDAAHMPQLGHDAPARAVHGVGDPLPAFELLRPVQAGHIGIALALLADRRGFADQQAGAGALGIVGGHQGRGNGIGSAVARQRGHRHAVGQVQLAGTHRIEQCRHGRLSDCSRQGKH